MIRGERFRRPLLLVGGRGAQGPAPVSASLYRLRRQTALLGTVSPSSCEQVGGGQWIALRGTLAAAVSPFHSSAHGHFSLGLDGKVIPAVRPYPAQQRLGRVGHSHLPAKAPQGGPRRIVSGSIEPLWCSAPSSRRGGRDDGAPDGQSTGKPYNKAPSRQPSAESTPTSLRASKERDRWSSGRQSAAKP